MFCRRLIFVTMLSAVIFSQTCHAQGGLVSASTNVRYTPVAFSQIVQLSDFNTITISLHGSDANGESLAFALVTSPSHGSLGLLNSTNGTIAYTPPAGFSTSDSFTFLVTDGVVSSEAATVTIFAPQPAANLSVSSLDLGSQLDGTKSLIKSVAITNPTSTFLSIGGIDITGQNAADFAIENGGTCPRSGTLTAGASCTVSLSFTPSATGARTATLAITDSAFDSPQMVTANGAGTDFSFAPANGASTSATVAAGQTATYNLQINSAGFTGAVSLACTGAPQLASCNVSAPQINVNRGPTSFVVNVSTTAPTVALLTFPESENVFQAGRNVMVLATLLGILCCTGRRKRSTRRALSTAVLTVLALLILGCGSKTAPPITGQPGTPAGSYTLTLTGTSGGASRSIPLSLTVR